MNSNMAKLVVAIVLDILDFTVGRVAGFGSVFDAIMGVTAVILWGWPGLFAFWELVDPTDQADGFVPTMTLIALSQMGKGKRRSEIPEDL